MQIVRSMPGCERAEVLRWGYAVEYDMVWPHQIDATCMTKRVQGLFLAGQINGTSGYEEAGGQGLVAGLNSARYSLASSHVSTFASTSTDNLIRLGRDQAYIGVMMDDLVTRTPREPYRMFTSRAEHRLLLRAENADERLTPLGRELGLVDNHRWSVFEQRRATLDRLRDRFDRVFIEGKTLREVSRRPETGAHTIAARLEEDCDVRLVERVITEARYDGYVIRQRAEIKRQVQAESQRIPAWMEFEFIEGLRAEAVESLRRFRPATMGQAGRLAGMTPADMTLLAVTIRNGHNAHRRKADVVASRPAARV
jgi:tRNA uridine 5-carboxymethylaminomethyl modification enzyme